MRTVSVLLILVVAVPLLALAGCGKATPPPQTTMPTPAGGMTGGPPQAAPPAPLTGPLADLAAARAKLTSYQETTAMSGGQSRVMYVKLEGGKPIEMKRVMGQDWDIADITHHVTYSYDSKKKVITKTSTQMRGVSGDRELRTLEALKPKITEADLDGVPCVVVEATDSRGRSTKTWFDKQYGLRRQMEMGGQTAKIKYEMINSVPDSEFKPPSGIKIVQGPPVQSGMGGRGGPGGPNGPGGRPAAGGTPGGPGGGGMGGRGGMGGPNGPGGRPAAGGPPPSLSH